MMCKEFLEYGEGLHGKLSGWWQDEHTSTCVKGKSIFSQDDIFTISLILPNTRKFNFTIFMLHKPIAKGYFCEFLISRFCVHSRNSQNNNLVKISTYTIVFVACSGSGKTGSKSHATSDWFSTDQHAGYLWSAITKINTFKRTYHFYHSRTHHFLA